MRDHLKEIHRVHEQKHPDQRALEGYLPPSTRCDGCGGEGYTFDERTGARLDCLDCSGAGNRRTIIGAVRLA